MPFNNVYDHHIPFPRVWQYTIIIMIIIIISSSSITISEIKMDSFTLWLYFW